MKNMHLDTLFNAAPMQHIIFMLKHNYPSLSSSVCFSFGLRSVLERIHSPAQLYHAGVVRLHLSPN